MHDWYKFGDFSSNPYKLSPYKPNFQEYLVKNGRMTAKVKVNDPNFQNQLRVSQDACLVQIWWFQLMSASYCPNNPNFLEFWVKMAKMTLQVKVNDPDFQYRLSVSQDACLGQIWWFQPKSVMMSYGEDKPNFLEFWVKMAKMTLKVKVNDSHFQYQSRVSHNACVGATLVIPA